MTLDEAHDVTVEEENYFVSMTDMMVGLIFVFIILLMFYVLQFRDVTDQLTSADRTREQILDQLKHTLQAKGVPVTVDTQNGVLRLPDAILFDSGRPDLKPDGIRAVGHLADALADVLPCYTEAQGGGAAPKACPRDTKHHIESIYLEGHTDTDNLRGLGPLRDNWDLSVARATNTYRQLTNARPELATQCSRQKGGACEPVLSVSGYGPQRPIDVGTDAAAKARNRRIDLRIIMVQPDGGEAVSTVRERLSRQ